MDLSALVEDVVASSQGRPEIAVSAQIEGNLLIVAKDVELRRMINNILTNAIRYGKTPGKDVADVDITCIRSGDEVLLEIADHGLGVPEDSFDRMLRPFTRMDNARGQANGSGLGLAIVARIAKSYQGRLRLKCREGGGLVVQIAFPLLKRVEVI